MDSDIFCKSLVLYTNRDPFIRAVSNDGFTVQYILQLKDSFLTLKLIQLFITLRSILQIMYVMTVQMSVDCVVFSSR
jgi:hypothetical protein